MRKLKLIFFSLIINLVLIFILLSSNTSVADTTIDVFEGESIQEAINLAEPTGGDTVYVHDGIYELSNTLLIDRPLNLIGESKSSVTINCKSNHTIKITSDNVEISDLKIKNSEGTYQCIWLDYVSNCIISNNFIEEGICGIYLIFSNENTIEDNNFEYNYDYGINSYNSDSNTIKSNSFQGNNQYVIFFNSNSDGNTVYLNDFNDLEDISKGKTANARDDGANNWYLNSQGNYWDNYDDYDSNSDGTGDNPYEIGGLGKNEDIYPLGDFLTSSENPVAYIDSISPNPAEEGVEVTLNGHGSDDGSIINWEWKSSIDGILSYSKNYHTSYLSEGTHEISLRVLDNEGHWSDPEFRTLVITRANDKPTAYILEPTTSVIKKYGEAIEFLGSGSDDGQIVEYFWRSSIDGYLSNAIKFTKNDLSEGQHNIYLKVKDDKGDWSVDSSIDVIILSESSNNAPIAISGGPYSGIANQVITFDASDSYDPDNGDSITDYNWDFGDGSTGEGVTPKHTYSDNGNYTISLTIKDTEGEERTVTTYVNISSQASTQDEKDNEEQSPGFEIIFIIVSFTIIFYYKKRKKKN